jgi:Zn-dependent protease
MALSHIFLATTPHGGLGEVRRGMVMVAAAGPAMNIALAVLAAPAFHSIGYLPVTVAQWFAANLKYALVLNVVLCRIAC